MNEYTKIAIWAGVIAVIFVILWRKGTLRRIADYVRETREELRRCTWPTWGELRGSTVVVMISIVILGCYTVVIDLVFALLVRFMTSGGA